MKKLIILSTLTIVIASFSCTKKEHSCQSRKMLKEHANDFCVDSPLYHIGVCGCDGKTYGSTCEANKNGMSVEYEGACK